MKLKFIFSLIEYLGKSTEFFWDFSKFLYFPPLVDIYRHPLLSLQQVLEEWVSKKSWFASVKNWRQSEVKPRPFGNCDLLARAFLRFVATKTWYKFQDNVRLLCNVLPIHKPVIMPSLEDQKSPRLRRTALSLHQTAISSFALKRETLVTCISFEF